MMAQMQPTIAKAIIAAASAYACDEGRPRTTKRVRRLGCGSAVLASASDADSASEASAGLSDDIQQFNAWLEGLKKT